MDLIPKVKLTPRFRQVFDSEAITEAFMETNKFSSSFPSISKLWQFHHLSVCVNSPELIEKVLMSKSCLQRPLFLLKLFDVNEFSTVVVTL